ncbi:MAG: hypothetical protein KME10_09320 [Plectolyngbya sp. WJT66-NPBG17]|jgi:hypothetical protein|nr:hypothetical protein [Plectolyngbya sp. WJT66-NPBG17]MBW4525738.1 hypothetical protein [Phormidium tanganyikae FI6-MK23]
MVQQSILTESFRNAEVNQLNWIFGASRNGALPPILTARSTSSASPGGLPGGGTDTAGNGVLRLTNNTTSQGSFVIYDRPINASAGLSVDFVLYSYGSTTPGADGLSFFLIDGSQKPTTAGAVGRSLGYSLDSDPGFEAAGIVGGYLGIGFDEYGNFSTNLAGAGGGATRTAQSITVRGREGLTYPLLATTGTLPGGARIDAESETRGTGRRARIDLTASGVLSVFFDLNGDSTLTENERVISNVNVVTDNGALPSTFKFGFSASTGGLTNVHEVNNLEIKTFDGAYTPLVSFPPINSLVTPNNPLVVTASLDVASTQPVVIPLNIGGTATRGTDYSLSADSITIEPGQTTGSVVLTSNTLAANGKTVQISLQTPSNAALNPDATSRNATLTAPSDYLSIVLQNPGTSQTAIWGLNGNVLAPSAFVQLNGNVVQPGTDWRLISNNADFNADSIPDMVWYNTANTRTAIWYMQPGTTGLYNVIGNNSFVSLPGATSPVQPGAGWELVTVATRSGSTPEFVWENRISGASAIWQLNISPTTGAATVATPAGTLIKDSNGNTLLTGGAAGGWKLIGAGNFGGSGTKDLLWFNTTTTETTIWQLNGTTLLSAGSVKTSGGATAVTGAGWQPVAIANVDQTGTDEIVWQNGGQVAVWSLGSNFTLNAKSTTLAQTLAAGEQIQAVADVDLDGTLDLLARITTSNVDTTRIYTIDPTTFAVRTPTTARFVTFPGQTAPVVTGDARWNIIDPELVTAAVT